MRIKYILYLVIVFLFFQCKTTQLGQIEKEIRSSFTGKFLTQEIFDSSRDFMFKKLSPEILNSDTIILLEYFIDSKSNYAVTIYESSNQQRKRYNARKSIKGGRVHVDSLALYPNVPDKHLDLARKGKLEDIIKSMEAETLTPSSILILNIGIKDKEKNKFNFTTLIAPGW